MKKTFGMMAVLCMAVLMASCDKLFGGGSGAAYTMTAFAFQEEEDGEWGIMDMDGKVLVKPQFKNSPTAVINGTFAVSNYEEGDEENITYTVYSIDGEGNTDKIGTYKDAGSFTSDLCPVVDMKDNVRYIDKEGNSPFDIKKIKGQKPIIAYAFFDGLAMLKLENGKWGYINEQGEVAIPFKYDDAWNFAEGLGIVYNGQQGEPNAKWSVIDKEGNVLFTKKFEDMEPSNYRYYDGLLAVKTIADNRIILIDREGKAVKKLKEDVFPSNIYGGIFAFYNGDSNKYGLMNAEGKILMNERYDNVSYNGKILTANVDEKKAYLFNTEGEKLSKLPKGYVMLFEPEFKKYDQRLLVGSYDEGYVLVDNEGNELDTEADIYGYNSSFWFNCAINMEEEDFDGDYYDEEMAADSVAVAE